VTAPRPHRLLDLLGIEQSPVSHRERLISGLGGMAAIAVVMLATALALEGAGVPLVVASMGASAVLLFAVPHGALSQPWPLAMGHLASAAIGVACAQVLGTGVAAAALAVGLAVAAMHYLRAIHPPGGATALTAVVGGEAVTGLGFGYMLAPVLVNVLLILAVAVAFNYPFPWRRYPTALARRRRARQPLPPGCDTVRHGDIVHALEELESFVDVTEEDLVYLYEVAARRAARSHLAPGDIHAGRAYSNGRYGEEWAVRMVVDEGGTAGDPGEQIIYKVVAGAGRRTSGVTTRGEMAAWAHQEVVRDENTWRPVEAVPDVPR
jgi:CBS-domain-containing membrane protein